MTADQKKIVEDRTKQFGEKLARIERVLSTARNHTNEIPQATTTGYEQAIEALLNEAIHSLPQLLPLLKTIRGDEPMVVAEAPDKPA